MALHATQRDGDVGFWRRFQIARRGGSMKRAHSVAKLIALLRVLRILEDRPPWIVRQVEQISAARLEIRPAAGHDCLQDLLRHLELLSHDAIRGRSLSGRGSRARQGDHQRNQEQISSLGTHISSVDSPDQCHYERALSITVAQSTGTARSAVAAASASDLLKKAR